MLVDGMRASQYASEGQQRSAALALKVAQADAFQNFGDKAAPLLLVDDIFGELDPERRNALLDHLPVNSQKLITATAMPWRSEITADAIYELRDRQLMRVSGTDWAEGGWDIEQTVAFARELEARGCGGVHVSSGGLVAHQKIPVGPSYQVPLARAVKAATSMPVVAVGLITEFEQAELPHDVDTVVACTSLHHVADPAHVIGRIADVLAPGGTAITAGRSGPPARTTTVLITRHSRPRRVRMRSR